MLMRTTRTNIVVFAAVTLLLAAGCGGGTAAQSTGEVARTTLLATTPSISQDMSQSSAASASARSVAEAAASASARQSSEQEVARSAAEAARVAAEQAAQAAAEQAAAESAPAAGSGGSGCTIKGNINSKGERIYHVDGKSPSDDDTVVDESAGERWFCSEAEAQAAGWRAPKNAR